MNTPNMASHRRRPSPTPSTSSMMSDASLDMTSEEQAVRSFAKKRLSKRIFLGHYQERRFVETLGVYRDMVVLHSSEEELKHDIMRVQSKLYKYYGFEKWIGITSPDTIGAPAGGFCLWVKLQDVAFGFYWFQIRRIRYHDSEITVHLKAVRPVKEEILDPASAALNIRKALSDNVDALTSRLRTSIHSLSTHQDSSSCANDKKHNTATQKSPENIAHSGSSTVPPKSSENESSKSNNSNDGVEPDSTSPHKVESLKLVDFLLVLQFLVQNWKDVLKFFSAAIVGLLQGAGTCIHYIGEFCLKLIREVSLFCRSVTPIVLAVIELVGKLIGGLYLLIAMIFSKSKDNNATRQLMPPQSNRRAIQYRH